MTSAAQISFERLLGHGEGACFQYECWDGLEWAKLERLLQQLYENTMDENKLRVQQFMTKVKLF